MAYGIVVEVWHGGHGMEDMAWRTWHGIWCCGMEGIWCCGRGMAWRPWDGMACGVMEDVAWHMMLW